MNVFKGHDAVTHPKGSGQGSWFPFVCGHCNREVSGAIVSLFKFDVGEGTQTIRWIQCPVCGEGSVRTSYGAVFPGVPFGPSIEGMPDEVHKAYEEARRCMSVSAFTAAELLCRKILMHVAVEKGASVGESFAAYVTHLEKEGYVTPPMKEWVELIRTIGNEATHTLAPPSRNRAESTVMFTAELLRLTYEMEHMTTRYKSPDTLEEARDESTEPPQQGGAES